MLLGQDFSDLTVMATRDGASEASVHYLFRLLNAGDFVLGKDSERRFYYSLSVDSQLLGSDSKVIYSDRQQLHEFLRSDQVEQLRPRAPGDRWPAGGGSWEISVACGCHEPGHQAKLLPDSRSPVPGSSQTLVMSHSRFCLTGAAQRDPNKPYRPVFRSEDPDWRVRERDHCRR